MTRSKDRLIIITILALKAKQQINRLRERNLQHALMEPRPGHGFVYGRRVTRPHDPSDDMPIRRLLHVAKGTRKASDIHEVT